LEHPDWLLVEEDESWFHRFIQPHAYAWSATEAPLKLIKQPYSSKTPDKALSCFGALCQKTQQIFLEFAVGYPNSEQMWRFVCRLLKRAKSLNKTVLVLIWDNASWHTSKRIRGWIRAYNRWAKKTGNVRLLVFWLPKKSPWLNPIEPYWGHAKRRVCEPSGNLSIAELRRRIRAQFETVFLQSSLQLSDPV
jgi:transposase